MELHHSVYVILRLVLSVIVCVPIVTAVTIGQQCLANQKLRGNICCFTLKCDPGHSFNFCSEDQGYDTCQKCPPGYTHQDKIDTKQWDYRIDPCVKVDDCSEYYLVLLDGECVCDVNKGFYGRDRNKCGIDDGDCKKAGYQLTRDGDCQACDEDHYKSEEGIYGSCILKTRCGIDQEIDDPGSSTRDRTCRAKSVLLNDTNQEHSTKSPLDGTNMINKTTGNREVPKDSNNKDNGTESTTDKPENKQSQTITIAVILSACILALMILMGIVYIVRKCRKLKKAPRTEVMKIQTLMIGDHNTTQHVTYNGSAVRGGSEKEEEETMLPNDRDDINADSVGRFSTSGGIRDQWISEDETHPFITQGPDDNVNMEHSMNSHESLGVDSMDGDVDNDMSRSRNHDSFNSQTYPKTLDSSDGNTRQQDSSISQTNPKTLKESELNNRSHASSISQTYPKTLNNKSRASSTSQTDLKTPASMNGDDDIEVDDDLTHLSTTDLPTLDVSSLNDDTSNPSRRRGDPSRGDPASQIRVNRTNVKFSQDYKSKLSSIQRPNKSDRNYARDKSDDKHKPYNTDMKDEKPKNIPCQKSKTASCSGGNGKPLLKVKPLVRPRTREGRQTIIENPVPTRGNTTEFGNDIQQAANNESHKIVANTPYGELQPLQMTPPNSASDSYSASPHHLRAEAGLHVVQRPEAHPETRQVLPINFPIHSQDSVPSAANQRSNNVPVGSRGQNVGPVHTHSAQRSAAHTETGNLLTCPVSGSSRGTSYHVSNREEDGSSETEEGLSFDNN